MKTEIINITPEIARAWLEKNVSNRPLRKTVVERLGRIWARGEWKLTHQGIAFSTEGVLLDGQHRLTFIAHLREDAKVPMVVFTECAPDTFTTLDQGVKRTNSDALGVSPRLVSVATVLAKISNASNSSGLTPAYVAPFVDLVQPTFDLLMLAAPSNRRVYSAAPVMAAAVLQILRKRDADEVIRQYTALVNLDTKAMSASAAAFMRRYNDTRAGSKNLALFASALRVFDTTKPHSTKLFVRDQSVVIEDVRGYLARKMATQAEKSPVNAGPKVVAKPSRNSTAPKVLMAA